MERILEYIIDGDFENESIKTFLKQKLMMSSALISDLKKYNDGICVNNEKRYVTYILKKGDILRLTMYETASDGIEPVNIPLNIVYEDEDILIIDKAPLMPVHTSQGHYNDTVSNAVMYHYGNEKRIFHAVNRLDKDTSGLMCIAKNKYSHALLCDQIKCKKLKRRYTAIVCGTAEKCGTVCAPIARESVIKRCVDSGGQEAVTHFKSLEYINGYTVLELELETGRTHQIRVHMSYIGHPLLGDWLYGREDKKLFGRQALHSSYLELTHPITGKNMIFCSPLPEDMSCFIRKKGGNKE